MEKNKKENNYVNYNIHNAYVRLLQDGLPPKMMKTDYAILLAQSKGLDLVQISFDKSSKLPVCKIIDYGKFKYEQTKKEKQQKKAAKAVQVDLKEMYFSIRIDTNDKAIKINHIREFLSDHKTKVKISIKLSRREMNLIGMAKDLMHEILNNFNDIAELDSNPSFISGVMSCVIRPKK